MDSQRLKRENESLKKELKQLNDQLNKILEKVQSKPHLG
jgi:cell division protein FtsB